MKVEVDADELCKLKEAASSRGPLCFADLASLVNERDELLNQVGEMEDINGRLRSEIDAVVSERDALRMMVKESAFHKLRNERDWWRGVALSTAVRYDQACIRCLGELGINKKFILSEAKHRGYEVPE